MNSLPFKSLIPILLLLFVSAASGQINKANNSNNLNLGSSWVGGTVPVVGETAYWNTLTNNTSDIGGNVAWGAIRFDGGSGTHTINDAAGSSTITLDGDGGGRNDAILLNSSAGPAAVINANLALADSVHFTSSRQLTINGDVNMGVHQLQLFPAGSNSSITLNGVITGTYAGTHALRVGNNNSAGTITLANAANSFSGGIHLTANAPTTLAFLSAGALGSSAGEIKIGNTPGGTGSRLLYTGTTHETISNPFSSDSSIGFRLDSDSVGGSLTYNGTNVDQNRPLKLGGSGSGDNTIASDITDASSVIKDGNGKWVLTGSNDHGATTVNEGTLQIGNGGTAGTLGSGSTTIASGATLIIDRNATYSPLGEVTGEGTLQLRGGSGALGSYTGKWTRLGDSDTGGFHLDMGASLTDRGEIVFSEIWSGGKFTVASLSGYGDFRSDWGIGGNRTISVDQDIDTEYQGRIIQHNDSTRSVNFEKLGTGTLTLSGTSAYNNTTVSAGTLIVNGDLSAMTGIVNVGVSGTLGGSGTIGGATTVAGNLNPGNSPGTLTFNEDLTLESTATTALEFASLASFDVIANDGGDTLTAGGTLSLTLTGYTASIGDTFQVFDNWAGFAGSFSSITGTDLGSGLSFDTSNLLLDGTLSVVSAVPEPGSVGLIALMMLGISIRRKRIA